MGDLDAFGASPIMTKHIQYTIDYNSYTMLSVWAASETNLVNKVHMGLLHLMLMKR